MSKLDEEIDKLDEQIEMARRHVREGRRIVAAQRERIARGMNSEDAHQLLANCEQSLEIFERDLERLLNGRDKKV
jgi:hypothetical protein